MHEDTIRDIRRRCRMAMNGIVSASMREKGVAYKLNFGLTIRQICEIAKHYQHESSLAETLWKEDVREMKIMATMLYPVAQFTETTADTWVEEVSNQEIREQLCLNLLQNFSFAPDFGMKWAKTDNLNIRTTAYWLLARLFLSKKEITADTGSFPFIWNDTVSEDMFLRNAALLALKHIGRQSKEEADKILDRLSIYKNNPDLIKQEAYNGLHFEFDYYFEE